MIFLAETWQKLPDMLIFGHRRHNGIHGEHGQDLFVPLTSVVYDFPLNPDPVTWFSILPGNYR